MLINFLLDYLFGTPASINPERCGHGIFGDVFPLSKLRVSYLFFPYWGLGFEALI